MQARGGKAVAKAGRIVEGNGRKFFKLDQAAIVRGKFDSYKIVGTRGSGGFAAVYVAMRQRDNLLCILKMSFDVERDSPGGKRILRESQVMCDIMKKTADKTLVPQILDRGEVDGRPFLVMENLYPLEWSQNEYRLPDNDEKRKAFFLCLIDSLKAIHEAGYVHGDIKPGNIMQRSAADLRKPVLIDFGSAHPVDYDHSAFGSAPEWAEVTRRDVRAYTPGYAAGEDEFTVRKDIFALGQVIRDSFGKNVDCQWTEIINTCISRRSQFRYENLDELRKDIENIDRRRRRLYWNLRQERIREQREVERSLKRTKEKKVEWHEILKVECSDRKIRILSVKFPANERVHYVVKEPLPLDANTVLKISGKGILSADISGPASSVVVLRNYATLHNTNTVMPPQNDLTYVLVGPGGYLNFPNLKSSDYKALFPGRRRILRDIDAVTSFRFAGPLTFSGVEDETLKAIDESEMPARYKKVLRDFFKGEAFTVDPV